MASFAELDNDNKVINVIKISNQEIIDENGNESEKIGIQKCKELFGENTKWAQTFYGNTQTNRRGNPARIGGFYIEELDGFTSPKPYNSWILDEETLMWKPPVLPPSPPFENPIRYEWDDETLSWREEEWEKPQSENPFLDFKWNPSANMWETISVTPAIAADTETPD